MVPVAASPGGWRISGADKLRAGRSEETPAARYRELQLWCRLYKTEASPHLSRVLEQDPFSGHLFVFLWHGLL